MKNILIPRRTAEWATRMNDSQFCLKITKKSSQNFELASCEFQTLTWNVVHSKVMGVKTLVKSFLN